MSQLIGRFEKQSWLLNLKLNSISINENSKKWNNQMNENIKRNSLVCLIIWFSWTETFEACLCSTEPTYQSHPSSFILVLLCSSFTNLWFGLVWFSNDNSTVNSTNDFNGKKKTKLFFWNKNQKSLSLFVLWIDWWFFDDFFNKTKRELILFDFFNQTNLSTLLSLKSNQTNWL